jgi:hypothetical protein
VTSKLASLVEPPHPVICVQVSSSEALKSHSMGSEGINW